VPEPGDQKPQAQPFFVTTRWSVVLAAKDKLSPDSAAALEALCRAYWYSLYAYVRGSGYTAEDAQDLTQEFFARFLANEWQRASRQKRGAGIASIPLDTLTAEHRFATEPPLAPDELYERRWAMTLLDQTLDQLSSEFENADKLHHFEVMKEWLAAARGEIPYDAIAEQLGVKEGAARVAVHRLRKRFRELFREKIAETVAAAEDVDVEMRHLALVLSKA